MVPDVASARGQPDVMRGSCGCKEKAREAGARGYAGVWRWAALDAESKLSISCLVGGPERRRARALVRDLGVRVRGRAQLTSEALAAYDGPVELGSGGP